MNDPSESATPPSSTFTRPTTLQLMGTTPLRDAFRGRLTGRLDIAGACDRAGLPATLKKTILTIVRQTRLWRVERAEVGAELITHFRDGLDAGHTPDDLIASFGDPAVAARLIRRTKKQGRSIIWRGWIAAWKLLALLLLALILIYSFLFMRLHVGSSTLRLNATKELNRTTLTIPVNERAWTVYKQALGAFERTPDELAPLEVAWPRVPKDSPYRPAALAYLERQQPAIELIHKAAALPRLGYVVSDQIEPDVPGYGAFQPQTWNDPAWNENPPAIYILLPYLGVLRNFSGILVFDSMIAREQSDAARLMRNLRTTISLGEHAREIPVLISDLVGVAILARACDEILETLETAPSLLSEAQLIELAHMLGSFPRDGGELVRIDTESRFFEDVLQRVYTDDGRGNGHVTAAGLRFLNQVSSEPPPSRVERTVNPIAAALIADRASTRREYHALMAATIAAARTPPWTWTRLPGAEIDDMSEGFMWRERYPTIFLLMPALGRAASSAHRFSQTRDATLTAIALELHHRRTGAYPATLDQLVPTLLPSKPIDIFSGATLGYAILEGKPIIYSVGVDRKDDGGRRARNPYSGQISDWKSPEDAASMLSSSIGRDVIDGDWVLFPPLPPLPPPSEIDDKPEAGPRSEAAKSVNPE